MTTETNKNMPNGEMEVDFDKNVTRLYQSISNANWDDAMKAASEKPDEAKTWVVRHEVQGDESSKVMWRFLPIHSACARQPPESVVGALLTAYPQGAAAQDDQGMYPLHYACGNQASGDVVRLLLLSSPMAASSPDPHGMLPIHYLAQWGPAGPGIVDMLLFSNRDVADAKDIDGNTPLDLAREGDYPEREEVIKSLMRISTTSKEKSTSKSKSEEKPETEAEVDEVVPTTTSAEDVTIDTKSSVGKDVEKQVNPAEDSVVSMADLETCDTAGTGDKEAKSAHRTIAKLKAEVTKLEAERAFAEAELEEKMETEREALQGVIDGLKTELDDLKKDSEETKELLENEIAELRNEKVTLMATLKEERTTLNQTQKQVKMMDAAEAILKENLETVTKDRNGLKAKARNLEEHLNVLSGSLAAMLAKQEKVMEAALRQEEQMKKAASLRQKKLEELMKQESIMTAAAQEQERQGIESDESVKAALQAQQEQIESMAAFMTSAK